MIQYDTLGQLLELLRGDIVQGRPGIEKHASHHAAGERANESQI